MIQCLTFQVITGTKLFLREYSHFGEAGWTTTKKHQTFQLTNPEENNHAEHGQ